MHSFFKNVHFTENYSQYLVTTDAAAAAKSLQSCLTLCDPIDGSSPGSPFHGILQARTLEWVAISFSNAWKWKVKVKSLRHAWLLATPWAVAYQAPSSMGFSRQEYWSGLRQDHAKCLWRDLFPLPLLGGGFHALGTPLDAFQQVPLSFSALHH